LRRHSAGTATPSRPSGAPSIRRPAAAVALRAPLVCVAVTTLLLIVGTTGASSPALVRGPNQFASGQVNGNVATVNWSGYADTGATFTNASGSWIQPAASCTANVSQLASFWVGIDGYSSQDPTVEQIGTDSDCTKGKRNATTNAPNGKGGGNGNGKGGGKGHKGGPSYYAWYEFYPQLPVFLSTTTYPVAAGNSMSAQVSASGSTFTLTLSDGSENPPWQFTTSQALSPVPQESSAEWMAEAPQSCAKGCGKAQLTDFATIDFSNASADGQAISSFTDEAITMEKRKGHVVRAAPSALQAGDTAFSITWEHS
jgi:hypothetical protein